MSRSTKIDVCRENATHYMSKYFKIVADKSSTRRVLPWSRLLLAGLKLSCTHTIQWQKRKGVFAVASLSTVYPLYIVAIVLVGVLLLKSWIAKFAWSGDSMMQMDSLKGDMIFVFNVFCWCCVVSFWVSTITFRAKSQHLVNAFNELQQLWIEMGEPVLYRARFVLLIVVVLVVQFPLFAFCLYRPVSTILARADFVSENSSATAVHTVLVVFVTVLLSWMMFIANSLASVIFIFGAYIYSILRTFIKQFITNGAVKSERSAVLLKVFIRRADCIVASYRMISSPTALSSCVSIGSTLLLWSFSLIIFRVTLPYAGLYALVLFAGYSLSILGGALPCHAFRDKASFLKSRLPQILSAAHIDEDESNELDERLQFVLRQPTALGFFNIQPSLFFVISAFLFEYTMLFVQFKTILLQLDEHKSERSFQ